MTNEETVIHLIREALGPEDVVVTIESTRKDIEAWDSLGHLSVLAALDTHFDGKVGDMKEIATADSVQRILEILHIHGLV